MAHRDKERSGPPGLTSPQLPPADTRRWVISRKAQVLDAIRDGVLSRAEACARYAISEAELRLWERAVACTGVPGLRVTRVQIYRPVFEAGERLPGARHITREQAE
jgi:hypothetical protein